jgi:Uncharacterised nucleotidyltransferase
VMKGPEVAGLYPDPVTRPYGDLDILAEDPEAAQKALISAGFEPTGFDDGYYQGLHHLRPLRHPECRVPGVEIHRRPNWIEWDDPPGNDELFAAAVPGSLPVPGMLALPPAHHALAIAAHSWIELPLRRILDLLDVLVVSAAVDRPELDELARRWRIGRLWNTMLAAAEAVVLEGPRPWTIQAWARSLRETRDMTVLEGHARRWLSPFSALPLRRALPQAGLALARELTPVPDETWGRKLRRGAEAVSNPSRRLGDHARLLGEEARKPRLKRRSPPPG